MSLISELSEMLKCNKFENAKICAILEFNQILKMR
eukprot:UN15669